MEKPVELTLEQRQAYLEEFKATYAYGMSFSTMRITALSFATAVLGILASFAGSQQFYPALGASFLMVMTASSMNEVIAALNRATNVFLHHSKSAENRLGITGFASCLPRYLALKGGANKYNTGSYAFFMAARYVLFAVAGYSVVIVWGKAESRLEMTLSVAMTAFTVGVVVWNELFTRSRHDPSQFRIGMEQEWEEAWKEAQADAGSQGIRAGQSKGDVLNN